MGIALYADDPLRYTRIYQYPGEESWHMLKSLNLQAVFPGTFGPDHRSHEHILNVILGMSEIFQAHQIVYKMMN